MKAYFIISCLLAINTVFASPTKHAKAYFIEDEATPLFQLHLAKCSKHNVVNQPVYLRNAGRAKNPSSNDMIILNLEPPPKMQSEDIAERILYGDADVVHLRNASTNIAYHLFEMLQENYNHFIHVPNQANGLFIASKYPLSQVVITQLEQEDASKEEILDFVIHETQLFHVRASSHDLSMQVINSDGYSDENTTTPILLADLSGTLTIVKKHQFSPLQLVVRASLLDKEIFEILPIRRGGRDNDKGAKNNDNRSGAYGGGRINVEFGPGGPEWSASAYGGYEDNRGNYAEVDVKRNEDGKTSMGAEGGYDKNK